MSAIDAGETHYTPYEVGFSELELQAQRDQYGYTWTLQLPEGDDCAGFPLELLSETWRARWYHRLNSCDHSPGEMIEVIVRRGSEVVRLIGPADVDRSVFVSPEPTPAAITSVSRPEGGAALFSPPVALAMANQEPLRGRQAQQPTPLKVTVRTEAPEAMSENVSLPITVSVEPADVDAASIRDALAVYGATALIVSVGGPEFNVSPLDPQQLPWVDEERLHWMWVISAKKAGKHTLRVSVAVRGKPDGSAKDEVGEIWSGSVQITVEEQAEVGEGFNLGAIDWGGSLSTLAGLGLTGPWVFEQVKKRRRKKQVIQEAAVED